MKLTIESDRDIEEVHIVFSSKSKQMVVVEDDPESIIVSPKFQKQKESKPSSRREEEVDFQKNLALLDKKPSAEKKKVVIGPVVDIPSVENREEKVDPNMTDATF